MANNIKKTYIGAICNRDLEVLENIKKLLLKNYNISIVDLIKKGTNSFNVEYFQKKMKKYPITFLIVKLTTQKSNEIIYNTIKSIIPNIPILNNPKAVKICESRKESFRLIAQKCKNLKIPHTFLSISEAYDACSKGSRIIIKLDSHNIPNLPKNDRIIGIAKTPAQLLEFTKNYREEELFLQEYLGKFDIVYKVYVIGRWVVSITSHNRLRLDSNLTPLELIHIRVPIDKQLKSRIKRLGRKFGMTVFGVDYILTEDGPYIVDVNDFPSFRSVPEGVSLISDHIYNLLNMRELFYKSSIKVKS
jgi:glutathione synthase/RimK-type ligase-like ATP-grasp enzyme